MMPVPALRLTRPHAVLIFVSFALAYWLSYGLRAVNAVIGLPLQAEFGVTSGQLGFLTSLYFLTFAAMQVPLGLLLDRFGARLVECVLLLIAVLGCLGFALAPSFIVLCGARAMIGMGVSACLMAPYKGYRLWFAEKWQAPLASWMLMVGTAGVLAATTPASAALPILGWRGLFGLIAFLLLLVAALQWWVLPSNTRFTSDSPHAGWRMQWQGFQQILTNRNFWRYAPPAIFVHGGFMAIQGLWAAPWMHHVSQQSAQAIANTLFTMSLALLGSYFFLGWLARWMLQRHWPLARAMQFGMALSISCLCGILWVGATHSVMLWVAYAVSTCVMSLGYTAVNVHFPMHMTGRSTTALNFMIFFGAFVVQSGIGSLVDLLQSWHGSVMLAYRCSFGLLVLCQVLTCLWFVLSPRYRSSPSLA